MPKFSGLSAAIAGADRGPQRELLARAFADLDRDDRLQRTLVAGRAYLLSSASPLSPGLGSGRHPANPIVAHFAIRQLDAFASLIAAADSAPWPRRLDAVNAVDLWPFGFAMKNVGSSNVLRNFTLEMARRVKEIRCARLIVSLKPLDLIDPFSGTRLELSTCHV
jgi:hypothetical protein